MDINSIINAAKGAIRGDSVFFGVFISFFMAILRMIYSGRGIIETLLEGGICGCLTFIYVSLMNYFGVSSQLTVSVGGFIGFMGVKKISFWINRIIMKKLN